MDEEQIDNMSLLFYESVLETLGRKLNYDAVVNYAGNSFCDKSWNMIQEAYPLTKNKGVFGNENALAFLESATVIKRTEGYNERIGPSSMKE